MFDTYKTLTGAVVGLIFASIVVLMSGVSNSGFDITQGFTAESMVLALTFVSVPIVMGIKKISTKDLFVFALFGALTALLSGFLMWSMGAQTLALVSWYILYGIQIVAIVIFTTSIFCILELVLSNPIQVERHYA